MTDHDPGSREWLDQVQEEIIDPERKIVDPITTCGVREDGCPTCNKLSKLFNTGWSYDIDHITEMF